MLLGFKARVRTKQEIREHYAYATVLVIVSINDTKGSIDIIHMVMIPLKWAAKLIDKNATPHTFSHFLYTSLEGGIPRMENIMII